MMRFKYFAAVTLSGAVLLTGAPGLADTVYLKSGVRFDGVVREEADGLIRIEVDGRPMIFRPTEIDRVEENDRTGALDLDAIEAEWQQRDAALTEKYGLDAETRREVRDMMYELQTSDDARRKSIYDRLVALQEAGDVYQFLVDHLPELSDRVAPFALEAIYVVGGPRATDVVRANMQHRSYLVREMAIQLAARMGEASMVPLVARGLADHVPDVRAEAAVTLAALNARQATPALIELLTFADLRVSNASRQALQALWQEEVGEEAPQTVDEWNAFWAQHDQTVSGPFQIASLEPLIEPEMEFQDE